MGHEHADGRVHPAMTEAAARWCEVRIGELLGPAKEGRPEKLTSRGKFPLAHQERHAFRLLAEQQAKAWDLWLECWTQQAIAEKLNLPQQTISGWLTEYPTHCDFGKPTASRQHFDVWSFQ